MYVVTVMFEVDQDQLAAFMPLMHENAAVSLKSEPGCKRFDVCRNANAPQQVFLYEIYDDRAAFEAHLQSGHFKTFDNATKDMFQSKEIRTYDEIRT